MPVFRYRVELDHPVEEVFAWHRRPRAFERLTPPWEDVRVRDSSGGIDPGGRVVLELRKGPATLVWEVEHTLLEENRLFVDEQRSGPFKQWRHEHRFESLSPDRSAVEDVVEWEAPMGVLGATFGTGYIEASLSRMFRFRGERLKGDLALHARVRAARPAPMVVAITGAGGLIGTALTAVLASGGHEVRRVSRGRGGEIQWDPMRGTLDAAALEGVDSVVHLAGEPISGLRWTAAKKHAIRKSREAGTLLLARALTQLRVPPRVFVSSSAVGIYGAQDDAFIRESTSAGQGFLAEVCEAWEGATHPAQAAGIRTVHLRTGIVLSPLGGVLGSLLLPFQAGVGGRVGSGRQYMPWIDLDDEVGLIVHALLTPSLSGPMNAVAPNPVTNAAFTDTLGRVLRRPTVLPLPGAAVRALLGEMGQSLLLEGQRVIPDVAMQTGYSFLRPDLEDALRMQLGRFDDENAT
jgi:uncharacterized protein (TIGR01777 family)